MSSDKDLVWFASVLGFEMLAFGAFTTSFAPMWPLRAIGILALIESAWLFMEARKAYKGQP
jgi:hypothetical protein